MKNNVKVILLVPFLLLGMISCENKITKEKLNAGWQFYESELYWEVYFFDNLVFLFADVHGEVSGVSYEFNDEDELLKVFKYESLIFEWKLIDFSDTVLTFLNVKTNQQVKLFKIKGTNKIETEQKMDSMLNCYNYRMYDFLINNVENVLDEFKNSTDLDEMRRDCN